MNLFPEAENASKSWVRQVQRIRTNGLRFFLIFFGLPVLLAVRPFWPQEPLVDLGLEFLGQVLVFAGVLGRFWCTLYIGGRKSRELVTSGPYALCRNPLYFFSTLIGFGAALLLEHLVVLLLFLALFFLLHLAAVRREEALLASLFGETFERYRQTVPRFLPRLRNLRDAFAVDESSRCEFSPRHAIRGVRDSALILLIIPLTEGLEYLHSIGFLPLHW